ncbi:MAG: pyridoxal-phosphate dependent enzyme [Planctomycetes bacterium]|nr:pyridoxal-phosphate dependent enzyme [Planctomycetota bacterium]
MPIPTTQKATHAVDSVLEAIGDTPLVRLPDDFDSQPRCEIYLKLEYLNPSGSTKDRIALAMVRGAEARGELKPGGRIVECTSGNTGAGLAVVAACLGYDITLVIPDKMSQEKIAVLSALGAEVVVTPANVPIEDPMHYTKVAERLAQADPNSWWPNQYHNRDNTDAHYSGTGKEIWQQCGGQVDVFVAGAGTGGTLTGIAQALKEQNPEVKIIGVDPPGSILAEYWKTGVVIEPGPYAVEGVGEEEIPGAWDAGLIDDYYVVEDGESFRMTRKLAEKTGIFAGGSSGMNLVAALRIARTLPSDARVITILPDSGRAYLSKVYSEGWMRDAGYLPRIPKQKATVGDLLHEKEQCVVKPDDCLAWAIRQAGERGVRPLPIANGDELLGVLNEQAAAEHLASGDDLTSILVGSCLSPAPPVLSGADSWQVAAAALKDYEAVLVRNSQGWTSLNRRDWLRALGRLDHSA